MIGILKKFFGDKSAKDKKELMPVVHAVAEEFAKLSSISDDELRGKTKEFKEKIAAYVKAEEDKTDELNKKAESSETSVEEKEKIYEEVDALAKTIDTKTEEVLKEIMPAAFAVMKETARRLTENKKLVVTATKEDKEMANFTDAVEFDGDKAIWHNTWSAADSEVEWNMVHYDVQLMGGAVLHGGKIAEMQTGEGKTLVATLPVYLNALSGKGVHVVTVNNYLAKRDSQWMGPLYQFHGLSVDCVDNYQPNSEERREAYKCDIIFGTNNEFGFDYLRDNMTSNPESIVQRKHHFAIIDEVDSVLIDDARTPLIISGPTPQGDKHEFHDLKPQIEKLVSAQRKALQTYLSDAKKLLKASEENQDKKAAAEQNKQGNISLLRAYRGLPKNKALIKYLSEPGVKVQLQKTENFYMQDQEKEMPFIDEELYFVIKEKQNSVELTEKGIDLISGGSGSDTSFYVLPDLSIILDEVEKSDRTEEEKVAEKDNILNDYTVKAQRIHSMNQLLKAYCLFEPEVDYVVMNGKVMIVDEQTGRIMDGRRYSDGLHMAIEAKENVTVEAATQTYATVTLQNYFRMYHKLAGMTGTAETEAKEFWDIYELDVVVVPTNRPIQRDDMNDLVYKTGREKYNAVIEQVEELRAAGRPVLVGTTTVEISELLSRMLKMKKVPHQVLNAKHHQKESEVVTEAGKAGTVTIATNMAGRGTDIKLGEGVKEAGGLAILGCERHDSRRVDRQLRGRAGRQGDVGSSQFYVSLEDNLMRMFGSERIAKLMDRLGLKEGEVIQHGMITKSIERAQKKVEENNFGMRKHLLEYDDVMNSQRTVIYRRRRNALYGDRLGIDISNMFYDVCQSVVDENYEVADIENFNYQLLSYFGVQSPFNTAEDLLDVKPEVLVDQIFNLATEAYERKSKATAEQAFKVITRIYEEQFDGTKSRVGIPLGYANKGMSIPLDIEEAYESKCATIKTEAEKAITLAIIDQEWKEHLRELDDLRQLVSNAQYEQKDPLLIYKLESYKLFTAMIDKVNKEIVSFLSKARLPQVEEVQQAPLPKQKDALAQTQTTKTEVPQFSGATSSAGVQAPAPVEAPERPKAAPVVREERKIGRNDKVKIFNVVTSETKEVKFKVAEPLLQNGQWRIVD